MFLQFSFLIYFIVIQFPNSYFSKQNKYFIIFFQFLKKSIDSLIIEGSFKKKMKPIPKPNPLTYTILKTRSIIIPSILIKKKNHNPIPSTLFSLKHFDSQELNDYFFPNNKKKKKESSIDTSTIEESINRPFTLFHPPPSPPTYLQEK